MEKKILLINGHPDKQSFNYALCEAYKRGAMESNEEIKEICIADLAFDPNLKYGYRLRTNLEPDLVEAWEKIKWADHLVWIHPVWWGGMPALSKGFIDRLFLPGMAFEYRPGSIFWDKLLKNKTARIITTLDQPGWYYRLVYARPSVNQLKKSTLKFCGISPVFVTYVGIVKSSDIELRNKWLKQISRLGMSQK